MRALLALVGTALLSSTAKAGTYTAGDLLLGFTNSSVGSVYVLDLGSAITYRNATSNILNITNIGTDLSNVFGSTWYDNSSLYFGVVGVRSTTSGANGDPSKTTYLSASRPSVGTQSAVWGQGNPYTSGAMGTAGSQVVGMETSFSTALASTTASNTNAAIMAKGTTTWDHYNPPTTGSQSFGLYSAVGANTAGIEQTFAAGSYGTFAGIGAVEGAVDLYRLLATTTGATADGKGVIGTAGVGTYEGTFTLDQSGNVSFAAVPEPSTYAMLAMGAGFLAILWRKRSQSALNNA